MMTWRETPSITEWEGYCTVYCTFTSKLVVLGDEQVGSWSRYFFYHTALYVLQYMYLRSREDGNRGHL